MPQITGSLVAPRQSAAPSSPVTGQLYYDTDDNKLYWWNGTAWIDATGGGGGGGGTYDYFEQPGDPGASASPGDIWLDTDAPDPIPIGAAGGDLNGTYPNPQIASGAVVNADIANGTIMGNKLNLPLGIVSPPTSPNPGDLWLCYTPIHRWLFIFDDQDITPYVWKFIGGGDASSEVGAQETTTSTSYVDLTTVGPQITVPRSGQYDIEFGVQLVGAAGNFAYCSVRLGSTVASDEDSVFVFAVNQHQSRIARRATLAANDVVKVQYKVGGGTGSFLRRWLKVRPVRVS